MNIKDHFPRASKSFIDANPVFAKGTLGDVLLQQGDKDAVQPIVATRSPYSKKMLMNKTESEFAQILEIQKKRGENQRWEYEGITLRWADMKYTPDFLVFDTTSSAWLSKDHPEIKIIRGIRLIEVKGGHIWDRDIVRFKGARAFYPEFQFEMWQKKKGEWKRLH